MGWSLSVPPGSALCLPLESSLPVISCTRALPLEVTRSETCISPGSILGFGGSRVARPCQVPARVFSLVKAFCASDSGAAAWLCAKSKVENEISTTNNVVRSYFMGFISLIFSSGSLQPNSSCRSVALGNLSDVLLYITITQYPCQGAFILLFVSR